MSSTGTWHSPFGYAGRFGYQGDPTGFKLLGHRYYDPTVCRFLTRDPIKDGRNWYAYCANSPLIHADPDGLLVWKIALAVIVIGALTGCKNDDKSKGSGGRAEPGNGSGEPPENPLMDFLYWLLEFTGTETMTDPLPPVVGTGVTVLEGGQALGEGVNHVGAHRLRTMRQIEANMDPYDNDEWSHLTMEPQELWEDAQNRRRLLR